MCGGIGLALSRQHDISWIDYDSPVLWSIHVYVTGPQLVKYWLMPNRLLVVFWSSVDLSLIKWNKNYSFKTSPWKYFWSYLLLIDANCFSEKWFEPFALGCSWHVPAGQGHHGGCKCPDAKIGARTSGNTMLNKMWFALHESCHTASGWFLRWGRVYL